MRLKNVSPRGDLEVPAVRHLGIIEAGQEFDCDPETGIRLLAQPDNFEPVDAEAAAAVVELNAPTPTEPEPVPVSLDKHPGKGDDQ